MIKLTDRLQIIADKIKEGETMADIGSDHGFLPLYLCENGICPRVIITDISEYSLAKAKSAAGAFQFGRKVDFRAGDGLNVLDKTEVDVIVIAGMGGLLMTEMLESDFNKTFSFSRYIFQPRNNMGLLRHWLCSNGFEITENDLVREGKFICEIISAKPLKKTKEIVADYPDYAPQWDLPVELLRGYPDLTREYAGIKAGIEEKILIGLGRSTATDTGKTEKVRERLNYFRDIAEGKYNV